MQNAAETKAETALTKRGDFLAGIQTGGDGALSQWDPVGLADAYHVAAVLARSELVPKALRGRTEDTLLVMWHGRELGMSTLQSLQHLHVVYGKVGMSADMIRARCQAHPDCELFEILETSREKATLQIRKRGWPEGKVIDVTFTLEDARQAGLLKADSGWAKWSEDMLVARVTSRAARRYFPGVMAGIYTPEELLDKSYDLTIDAELVPDGAAPPAKPQSKADAIVAAAKRRAAAATPSPEPEPEPEEPEEEELEQEPEEPEDDEPEPPEPGSDEELDDEDEAAPGGAARLISQAAEHGKSEEQLRSWCQSTFKCALEDLPQAMYLDAFAWIATPQAKGGRRR